MALARVCNSALPPPDPMACVAKKTATMSDNPLTPRMKHTQYVAVTSPPKLELQSPVTNRVPTELERSPGTENFGQGHPQTPGKSQVKRSIRTRLCRVTAITPRRPFRG